MRRSAAEGEGGGAVRVFVRPLAMLAVGLLAAAVMWRVLMSDGADVQRFSQTLAAMRGRLLEDPGSPDR
jgi:hypothetical protein